MASTARTEAIVDIIIKDNATWQDAFVFGDASDLSWSFTGKTFILDIVANKGDAALVNLTDANGGVVVDDATNRVLHVVLTHSNIRSKIPQQTTPYVYDLIMTETSTGFRTVLMSGSITVTQGVTP